MNAYHFLQEDMTANSGDEKPWEVGETRTISDPSKIALCQYGYHSSPTLWDCLHWAQGPVVCLVKVSKPIASDGTKKNGDRKSVSATRQLIKAVNIDRELRLFACDCAERALHSYEKQYPADKRPRKAIVVARKFGNGKTTKKELAAAWDAAGDAAWAAAGAAARAAAWAAAWAAAGAAARAAAGAAAGAAARAAARDAERKWQRDHFNNMFKDIFK